MADPNTQRSGLRPSGSGRTFLTYPGGKARLARDIVSHMGPHRVYAEPFGGTASVLFAKPRAAFEVLNDRDEYVVTMLRVVRDRPSELAAALTLTPYARAEYEAADPATADDDLEVARRVCVRIGQSFAKSGLAAPSHGWRMSTTVGTAVAATWASLPDKIMQACDRLRGVHIECDDAASIIERHGNRPDAVLYVDPPYVGDTRAAQRIYRHEMADEGAHRLLGDALAACHGHVLLSGYHSPLYDEMFGDWHSVEFDAVANHNGEAGGGYRRTEVLWSNRPLSVQQALVIA